jgi:hypothetical protein
MLNNGYEVSVFVNGHKVDEYLKDGKVYIEARKDTKYTIKIKNNSWKKILAVPTVDGLSVINGKEASFNSPGYIIQPYSSTTIDGWRKNDSEVAEFYFSDMKKSYATKVEKAGNQGVIGVAIYSEKEREVTITKTYIYPQVQVWPWWNNYTIYGGIVTTFTSGISNLIVKDSDNSFNQVNCFSCQASNSVQDVGTGWGETKKSEVINTSFDEDKSSLVLFEIFYNTRKELEKAGIQFEKKVNYVSFPKSFPNEYCQEPKE